MVCLFADDTKLTRTFSNIADRADLQESLNEFINWADHGGNCKLRNTSAVF